MIKMRLRFTFRFNDKDGEEYGCRAENDGGRKSFETLSEEEKKNCFNPSQIVGTERW